MRNSDMKLTRHHIIPRSRWSDEDREGMNEKENIAHIKQHLHRKYHDLFGNKTPEEILGFLEGYFWNGNEEFVTNYFWRKG